MSNTFRTKNGPDRDMFANHFESLSKSPSACHFNKEYERQALDFLKRYDSGELDIYMKQSLEVQIVNENFTPNEIHRAINSLKSNKSPGIDRIPAEFLKYCKDVLLDDIQYLFNYIIDNQNFPELWAEGLRTPVYKNGDQYQPENYHGVTVLSILENVFEIAVCNRLIFVNEAFEKIDETNGAYLKGRRTSDNLFVLNGLIERQLILGKSLYICYVDFSKAFDLINRHILFYKIINLGWHGKVINTLRDLYSKTYFRVKCNGEISSRILDTLGVNQGGNVSGFLFRKYMADLSHYLHHEFAVVVDNKIIAHMLWADDLVLFSDTPKGLQRQLDGLKAFCSNNQMIVNGMKTKFMCFGQKSDCKLSFDNQEITQVEHYKYVGNLIKPVQALHGDIFGDNYNFLCDKAKKAIFAMKKKLKATGYLPPSIMFYMFNTLIQPILLYGSEIRGVQQLIRFSFRSWNTFCT